MRPLRPAIALLVICSLSSFPAMGEQGAISELPLPALVDRITWGATPDELDRAAKMGPDAYIKEQLHPETKSLLPEKIQRRIASMSISKESAHDALIAARAYQLSVKRMPDGEEKNRARKTIQKIPRARASETAERATLRALYSRAQLQEQMTWFWMNHFNVYARKGNIGAVINDYEDRAIRPNAIGKFRDLLEATMRSAAMMIYLDNQYNRATRINENYARELMELHTLGIQGGYKQADVQELARILTGLGISYNKKPPRVNPELRSQIVQDGAFIFNPALHDYGNKVFLGQKIKGEGLTEVDKAVDMLAKHPSTARHISLKLARYFVADEPSDALIDIMAKTFLSSDGDIAATLYTMFSSEDFAKSLKAGKFKDPVQYTYSSLRLAFIGLPPIDRGDVVNGWLSRMGEALYGRVTPDGYPVRVSDWSGSGQMTMRFELARQIATKPSTFYLNGDKPKLKAIAMPHLLDQYKAKGLFADISAATRKVIDGSKSKQEANMYLLASPEFMHR